MEVDEGEAEGGEGEDWLYAGHWVEGALHPLPDQEQLPHLIIDLISHSTWHSYYVPSTSKLKTVNMVA